MKKRLRKKLHKGEFQELGFEIKIMFHKKLSKEEQDVFLDRFIDLIESLNCITVGYNNGNIFDGIIAKFKGSVSESEKEMIKNWCSGQTDISSVTAGDFRDMWYGYND